MNQLMYGKNYPHSCRIASYAVIKKEHLDGLDALAERMQQLNFSKWMKKFNTTADEMGSAYLKPLYDLTSKIAQSSNIHHRFSRKSELERILTGLRALQAISDDLRDLSHWRVCYERPIGPQHERPNTERLSRLADDGKLAADDLYHMISNGVFKPKAGPPFKNVMMDQSAWSMVKTLEQKKIQDRRGIIPFVAEVLACFKHENIDESYLRKSISGFRKTESK